MQVREVMTANVHSCRPDTTARDALRMMWERDIGVLPIVEESGRAVGMVTDRDIAMACCMRDVSPTAIRVDEISGKQVWAVGPDDAIERAEQVMEERQVRRLPVIDNDRVVGIVSLADLARRQENVPAHEVAKTFSAITEPHRGSEAGA